MRRKINSSAIWVAFALVLALGSGSPSNAQSYPIDCAILLCLSGGWPASEPCARARAEFVRRITPWPVEPPLQIWRCPMGASFEPAGDGSSDIRIHDAWVEEPMGALRQFRSLRVSTSGVETRSEILQERVQKKVSKVSLQQSADIDIDTPEFDFVRSIRVFHVRFARQRETGPDGQEECRRSIAARQGIYGTQGEFSWHPLSVDALPEAHVGMERWGESCPQVMHRSVFVDWRDYQGNYGFEQVDY